MKAETELSMPETLYIKQHIIHVLNEHAALKKLNLTKGNTNYLDITFYFSDNLMLIITLKHLTGMIFAL